MTDVKKIFVVLMCSAVVLSSVFASCSKSKETSAQADISESTTESTTVTTTEDPETTFEAVAVTRQIYDALERDPSADYEYLLAEYTTYYSTSDETRTRNIENAVSKINNVIIPAGSVFSFNQNVGKRTVTAGFEEAHVIVNNELVDGLGGGICQVSSTIFEAVLRADMEIVERYNHSLKIGYVPMGGDATVDWGGLDFQFKNNKECPIKLEFSVGGGALKCKVLASEKTEIGKVEIEIKKTDKKGLKYKLVRKVDGEINYTAKSTYHEEKKETTTKKDKDKKETEKENE